MPARRRCAAPSLVTARVLDHRAVPGQGARWLDLDRAAQLADRLQGFGDRPGENVRRVQLDEALQTLDHIAVYYDRHGLITERGPARLEYDRFGVSMTTGVLHAKHVLLLIEDEQDDRNSQRLVLVTTSANLTRSGWWENAEVAHVHTLHGGDKDSLRNDLLGRRTGAEDRRDAGFVQDRNVLFGDDPADDQRDVEVGLVEGGEHRRSEREVAGVVHGEAHGVGVLFFGRGHDGLGGLAQAQVDDLHACVAQDAGDHLDATVVAVQPQLGQDDPNLVVSHQTIAFST